MFFERARLGGIPGNAGGAPGGAAEPRAADRARCSAVVTTRRAVARDRSGRAKRSSARAAGASRSTDRGRRRTGTNQRARTRTNVRSIRDRCTLPATSAVQGRKRCGSPRRQASNFSRQESHGTHIRQPRRHVRQHAAGENPALEQGPWRHRPGQDGVDEPRRQRQRPDRRRDDRGGGARGQAASRHGHHRADQRQHRHRAGLRGRGQGLPLHPDDARDDDDRAPQPAQGLRSATRADARCRGHEGRDPQGAKRSATAIRPSTSCPASSTTRPTPRSTAVRPAEEIWRDTDGEVDVFVAGVGTGGTITGVGARAQGAQAGVTIITVEPDTSRVLSGGSPGPAQAAGFRPGLRARDPRHESLQRSDPSERSRMRSRRRAGSRAKRGCWSASRPAPTFGRRCRSRRVREFAGKTIVTIGCDTGERYFAIRSSRARRDRRRSRRSSDAASAAHCTRVLVEMTRGPLTESVHRVAACALDATDANRSSRATSTCPSSCARRPNRSSRRRSCARGRPNASASRRARSP